MTETLLGKIIRHRRNGSLAVTARRYLRSILTGRGGAVWSLFVPVCVAAALSPLAAISGLALLGVDLAVPSRRVVRHARNGTSAAPLTVEVVIVTWNGADLLRTCLPSVVEAARYSPVPATIMVVDNASTDDTIELLETNFPTVRVLRLAENFGFGGGNNRGVAASSADVVLLLNNDMVVERDFIQPLLYALRQPETFAATSQIMMRASVRREETGRTTGAFRSGKFHVAHAPLGDADLQRGVIPVFWAGGGSMAVRREQFLAMGGFAQHYEPFYWEDTDLSYRALKAGFQVFMVPQSKVLHLHQSTTSRFPRAVVQRVVRRNEYLFTWTNLHDWRWLSSHFLLIPTYLMHEIRAGGTRVAVGALLMAFARLPSVVKARAAARRESLMSDRAVVGRFAPISSGAFAE